MTPLLSHLLFWGLVFGGSFGVAGVIWCICYALDGVAPLEEREEEAGPDG